ncbi:MAG: hypothetical protein ACSHYB_10745 [Roseibacillus sp.]
MKVSIVHRVAALFIGASALSGQTLNTKELEDNLQDLSTPPRDRVVDFGEVFSAGSSSRTDLSRRLDALNERYQFSVYYIAYSGIIGSNVGEKAAEFRDLWLGTEEEGLVFVCDTDMKTVSYALTKVDSFPIDGSIHTWKLPDHEVVQAMLKLSSIDAEDMNEEEYLGAMGHTLTDELESRLKSEPSSGVRNTGGILGTIGAAAGLIGISVWWIKRRSGTTSSTIEGPLFPTMEIPNRLGAHFGGGTVCEISYQAPPSPTDS